MSEQIRPDQEQKRPWGMPGRARQWGLVALSVGLLAFILVGLNLLSRAQFRRFDWTIDRKYELEDATVKKLEALDKDVTIYLTGPGQDIASSDRSINQVWQRVEVLCQEFQKRTKRIRIVHVTEDMAVLDELKRHFNEPQANMIYVVSHLGAENYGRKVIVVSQGSFYDGDPNSGKVLNFHGERWLLAALNAVTITKKRIAYSLIGHDELRDVTGLRRLIDLLKEREGIELYPYPLREAGKIPDDAEFVMVVWPKTTPSPAEFDALRDYLFRGGRLFVALQPTTQTGFDAFLEEYGVSVGKGVVVDRRENTGSVNQLRVQRFGPHEINSGVVSLNSAFTMPITSTVEAREKVPQHVQVSPLLFSGPEAWEETGTAQVRPVPDPGERTGQMSLAVAVQFRLAKPGMWNREDGRIVVWGSAYALTDANLYVMPNVEYILNNVRWLTGHEEQIADIKPKRPSQQPMDIPAAALKRIKWVTIAGFPALGVLVGLVAWFIRRK